MNPSLGEIVYIDFVTLDEDGKPVAPDNTPSVEIYENGGANALNYSPTIVARSTVGRYTAALQLLANLGFVAGRTYSAWANAAIGGDAFSSPVASILLRASDTDDLAATLSDQADTLATIQQQTVSSTITPVSPLGATSSDPLSVLTADEYSAATGQPVTFNVVVSPTPDAIFLDVSVDGANVIHTGCDFTGSGTLTVTVPQLTPADIALLPLGALADFRFFGLYGDTEPGDGTPERTLRSGKVDVASVAAAPLPPLP